MSNIISIKEITLLTIFFTALAVYYDIHGEHRILSYILNHIIALLLALILSKSIYHFIPNRK
jgi:hypothetical protein